MKEREIFIVVIGRFNKNMWTCTMSVFWFISGSDRLPCSVVIIIITAYTCSSCNLNSLLKMMYSFVYWSNRLWLFFKLDMIKYF